MIMCRHHKYVLRPASVYTEGSLCGYRLRYRNAEDMKSTWFQDAVNLPESIKWFSYMLEDI